MSPVPHRIYSQELSRAFKRGHPIANPQPVDYSDDDDDDDDDEDVDDETSTLRPVEIGDVGYIQHDTGLFIRLFNVHLEPGVDGQPARENLPGGDDFRPLRKGRVSKSKDATPVFVSQSVESVKLNAAASGPFFGGSAGFTASSKRGAILATPDPIESQNALNIPSYIIYARAHIKGWHAFYSQRHLIELEDIMLVTGVDRTTSWATAVFSDTKLEVGFGLDVQFVGAGPGLQLACQYSWRSTFGAFVNSGPVPRSTPQMSFPHSPTSASQSPSDTSMRYIGQGEHETERQAINTLSDQTLFIRHIRAKRRPWSGLKLQARGEKDDTNDESDGSGSSSGTEVDSVDIASYPRREKFVDCLEPALDYILQNSAADLAIAHDDDLDLLDGSFNVSIQDGVGIITRPMPDTSDVQTHTTAEDHASSQDVRANPPSSATFATGDSRPVTSVISQDKALVWQADALHGEPYYNYMDLSPSKQQEAYSPYVAPPNVFSSPQSSLSGLTAYSPMSWSSGTSSMSSSPMFNSPYAPNPGYTTSGVPNYTASLVPGRGRMIPQSKYRPHTAADRDRYVNKIQLFEPVLFNTTDPGVVGIALSDALAGKYQQLEGRDDRLFQQCGPSISIRINWAGCYPSWSRQIPTRDFKNPPGPVSRSKVAKNVARSVQRFIDEMNTKTLEEDADDSWAVGRARNGIVIEDLALVRLENVSKGSWQAQLCFVHAGIAKGPL